MEQLSQENNMSYKAPKVSDVVQKTQAPLINLGETTADIQNQRKKQGLLSTFLQGARNRTSGTIAGALGSQRQTLGSSNI
jgi:hypothetical protein